MSLSVIALYNDFEVAARAVDALVGGGFDRDDISVVANDADERYSSRLNSADYDDGDVSAGEGAGFGAVVGGLIGLGVALIPGIGPVLAAGPLAAAVMAGIGVAAGAATGGVVAGLVDLGVSAEDAEVYAEGIRRGGAVVTVDVNDEASASRAKDILDGYNPVDINERGEIERLGTASTPVAPLTDTTSKVVNAGEQQKLDVVEEEVEIGKRQVRDGVVRVHTRVTERPVEEQVQLREERVTVERHPVDRPADPAEINAFQEATIEVTESHEEPVVSKTARVVEEVVVGKQAQEHVETVRETVRRKDVEVEGAPVVTGWSEYEPRFRSDYSANYAGSGTWDTYSPAYQYGYQLANDARYRDYTWDRLEAEAHRTWEVDHPSTWEQFKNAIRYAWEDVKRALS